MEQFSYSFIITMLHSIWQTALLLLMYGLLMAVHGKNAPLFKRNLLYAVVVFQLLTTLITFVIVFNEPGLNALQHLTRSLNAALHGSWLAANASIAFYMYAFVVLLRLGHLVVPWSNFKKSYQVGLVKPAESISEFTQRRAGEFGITQKVAIWCSNSITSPMTFGFWKPVILMPIALVNQLSMQETEALIIHELTHIRHFDYLLNRMLVLVESVFFFNPFIHIIAQQIRQEREKNCDQQVLLCSYDKVQYAETLLKVARHQQQLILQMGAVKRKNQLLQRIDFFSNHYNPPFRKGKSLVPAITLFAAVLVNIFLVTFSIVGPAAQQISPALANAIKPLNLPASIERDMLIKTEALATLSPEVASNKPAPLEAATTKRPLPAKQQMPDLVETEETPQTSYAIPAGNAEPTLYQGKEIRITEESSDGTKTTAVYQAVLIEGVWSLHPLWVITETKTNAGDSLRQTSKDSVITIYPVVQ